MQTGPSIPCLVIPPSLTFSDRDGESLKQSITIYNPGEVALEYKVSTNEPSRYLVASRHGKIGPRKSISISIVQKGRIEKPRLDKFRVEVFSVDNERAKGKKVLRAYVYPDKLSDEPDPVTVLVVPIMLAIFLYFDPMDQGKFTIFLLGMIFMYIILKLLGRRRPSSHGSSLYSDKVK